MRLRGLPLAVAPRTRFQCRVRTIFALVLALDRGDCSHVRAVQPGVAGARDSGVLVEFEFRRTSPAGGPHGSIASAEFCWSGRGSRPLA